MLSLNFIQFRKFKFSVMQEYIKTTSTKCLPVAPFWVPDPQFYILSEQRTNIKHDGYIPTSFQKRWTRTYTMNQHDVGIWE